MSTRNVASRIVPLRLSQLRIRRSAAEVGAGAAVVGSAIAAAVIFLQLWRADLRVPFAYSWDANFHAMVVKGVLEHGWHNENPSLGAPFGQELYDFPLSLDNLHLVEVKALGLVASGPAVAMNLFLIVSFPLVALSAYLVLRQFRLSQSVAFVAALLFTLLPRHFSGEGHLFLTSYWNVPLAVYLLIALSTGEPPLFVRRPETHGRLRGYVTPRSLATVLLCVAVGSSSFYYSSFTILLAAAATAIGLLARRDARVLAAGAAVVFVIGASVLANVAPSLAYWHEHGRNPLVAQRAPEESERYALRLTTLLLPVDGHRFGPFAHLTERYRATTPLRGEPVEALGAVAGIGLLWLIGVALAGCVGRPVGDRLTRHSAALAVVAFLVATTGGISALIAYLATPQLRAWARLSLFIAFLSLVAVGGLLDRLRSLLATRRRGGALFAAALAAVLVVGALDETSDDLVPEYRTVEGEYRLDDAFVRQIDRVLPPGSMVYELPYLSFPEGINPGVANYDLVRPYLHASELRWSYGAMRGRPADWASLLAGRPLSVQAAAVAASGFRGIYVDGFGYPDGGAGVVATLRRLLQVEPLVRPTGRMVFFDLRPYRRRLQATYGRAELRALRDATLWPTHAEGERGLSEPEGEPPQTWRWATEGNVVLTVVNPANSVRRALFRTRIETAATQPAWVRISYPDGTSERRLLARGRAKVERRLALQSGDNLIAISTNAEPLPAGDGDARRRYLRLFDTIVTDDVLSRLRHPDSG